MPDLFILLMKINFALLLFAIAYYLVLRRLTFYVLNRVFLIFGIVFSSIYPFVDFSDLFYSSQNKLLSIVPKINERAAEIVPVNFISDYWFWIGLLFYFGVAVMAVRLFLQFFSLYRLHRKSKPALIGTYKVRVLNEEVVPFSFWQSVYINPSLHKHEELRTILAHEDVHVRQWHSIDIILAELSVVFYWFNLGVWLMKKAVKENLEFITDEKILTKGIDRKAYQYSLLDVGTLNSPIHIVNNFNLQDLKKRIKMMNAKRSSRISLSRYLFVLPIILVATLAFTISRRKNDNVQPIKELLTFNHLGTSNDGEIFRVDPVTSGGEKIGKNLDSLGEESASIGSVIFKKIFATPSQKLQDAIVQAINFNHTNFETPDTMFRLEQSVKAVRLSSAEIATLKIKLPRSSGDIEIKGRINLKEESPSKPSEIVVTGFSVDKLKDGMKLDAIQPDSLGPKSDPRMGSFIALKGHVKGIQVKSDDRSTTSNKIELDPNALDKVGTLDFIPVQGESLKKANVTVVVTGKKMPTNQPTSIGGKNMKSEGTPAPVHYFVRTESANGNKQDKRVDLNKIDIKNIKNITVKRNNGVGEIIVEGLFD